MIAPPKRLPGCPPTVELDSFAAGEPSAHAEHVASCAECGPYVAALKREAEDFSRQRAPELFLKQLERRQAAKAKPWWRVLGFLVPVAAALVLVVRGQQPVDEGVTLKGAGFNVFLKRGEAEPVPVQMNTHVQAGDALRFSYDAPSDGYLTVFELDGRENVTVFWPYGEKQAGPVKKGPQTLPGSVVLDDSPGPRWLVAVFSTKSLAAAPVAAQLKGQSTRPSLKFDCEVDTCSVTTLRLSKP